MRVCENAQKTVGFSLEPSGTEGEAFQARCCTRDLEMDGRPHYGAVGTIMGAYDHESPIFWGLLAASKGERPDLPFIIKGCFPVTHTLRVTLEPL